MNGKPIYITGDTHGDFSRFASRAFEEPPGSYVIICGDFGGIWDGSSRENYWLDWLAAKPYTFLFVDGNHENYDVLNAFPVSKWNGGNVHFIRNNIIHLMRGQIFDIEGIRFFAFGGARSHDISSGILSLDDPDFYEKRKRLNRAMVLYRIDHLSWWKEEMPSDNEKTEGLSNLSAINNKVDVVLSHCAPTSVQDIFSGGLFEHDDLTDYLETVKAQCEFKLWFFGHYHEDREIGRNFVMLYEGVYLLDDFLNDLQVSDI